MVWEFTRGMTEEDVGMDSRAEAKLQAYHGVLTYLRHKFADYEVEFQVVVMGVRTLMRQGELDGQLERLGLKEAGRVEVARTAAGVLVRANGYILRQRLEKLGQLGVG